MGPPIEQMGSMIRLCADWKRVRNSECGGVKRVINLCIVYRSKNHRKKVGGFRRFYRGRWRSQIGIYRHLATSSVRQELPRTRDRFDGDDNKRSRILLFFFFDGRVWGSVRRRKEDLDIIAQWGRTLCPLRRPTEQYVFDPGQGPARISTPRKK